MKTLVFTVKGQFAHWRKWFTTTSALTYSFPPRTAIVGLIGATLGIQRDDVSSVFPMNMTRIAVCPMTRIIKDRLPQIWFQSPIRITGGRIADLDKASERFQANLEVIRYPYYRIVFWHKDQDLMNDLNGRLKGKQWFYPPYLGMLGFLADVEFEADDEAEEKNARNVELHSILPLSDRKGWSLEPSRSGNYIREERIPLDVLSERLFRYLSVAYIESAAQPLQVKSEDQDISYFHLKRKNLNIMWMESCAN